MIRFYDLTKLELLDTSLLANKKLVSKDRLNNFVKFIESNIDYEITFDLNKILFYFKNNEKDSNINDIIYRYAYKIQGTDGIRGVVNTNNDVLCYFKNKTINSNFVYYYVISFISLLEKNNINTKNIAIATDGRELKKDSNLYFSIITILKSKNYNIHDLKIVPTPFLVYYSLKNNMPAIMLTASHNSFEYNGIKLFIDGKKLLPLGSKGEFSLTSILLKYLFVDNNNIGSYILVEKYLEDINIDKIKETYGSYKILIDSANGAFSNLASSYLIKKGFDIEVLADNIGKDLINNNFGITYLENQPQFINRDTNLPNSILKVFELSSKYKNILLITFDGDGDRVFISKYDSINDQIENFDGDAIAYSIISNSKDRGLFVTTIESDFSLSNQVKNTLNWEVQITTVGDRWLSTLYNDSNSFIASEKSGHIIMPKRIDDKVLLTGNGLYNALKALESNLISYKKGYLSKNSNRDINIDLFYRKSSLWIDIENIVETTFSFKKIENILYNDTDVLLMNFYDKEKEVGRFYVRKSGTEPKLVFSISLLDEYKEKGKTEFSNFMDKINLRIYKNKTGGII